MLIIVAEIMRSISLWNMHIIVCVSRVWINRSVEICQALFNIFLQNMRKTKCEKWKLQKFGSIFVEKERITDE